MRVLEFVKREAIATFGVVGAALTVLSKLTHLVAMPLWLSELLHLWKTKTSFFWQLPVRPLGLVLPADITTNLTVAFFLIMIGVGAKVSAWVQGRRDRRPSLTELLRYEGGYLSKWEFWALLSSFIGIFAIFVLTQDHQPGAPQLGRWDGAAASVLSSTGLCTGLLIGLRGFVARLIRLAAIVTGAVALMVVSQVLHPG